MIWRRKRGRSETLKPRDDGWRAVSRGQLPISRHLRLGPGPAKDLATLASTQRREVITRRA